MCSCIKYPNLPIIRGGDGTCKTSELVSQCYRNKVPQTKWLRKTETDPLRSESQNFKIKVSAGPDPMKDSMKGSFLDSFCFLPQAFLGLWQHDSTFHLHLHMVFLCRCLYMTVFLQGHCLYWLSCLFVQYDLILTYYICNDLLSNKVTFRGIRNQDFNISLQGDTILPITTSNSNFLLFHTFTFSSSILLCLPFSSKRISF